MNRELLDVQGGFRKGRGTRDQIANILWIIEKAREFQKKTSISAFLTMPKPLTVWATINCGIFWKRWDYHLTSLLRNLYAGQEATVRTGHGTTDWLVITFLPRSKHLLISWLQSPTAVILEFCKIKSLMVSIASPSICHEVMGPDAMILVLWMLSFKPAFSFSPFTFIKRLFSSSSLSAIRMVSSAYLRLLIFLLAILISACASFSLAFCMMYSACKLTSRVTIYSLDVLLSQFGTRPLFHILF